MTDQQQPRGCAHPFAVFVVILLGAACLLYTCTRTVAGSSVPDGAPAYCYQTANPSRWPECT